MSRDPAPAAAPARGGRFPLLPRDETQGWVPYAWLIYLPTFFVGPAVNGASPLEWAATVAATLVFLAAYFRGYWVSGRRLLPLIALQAALAAVFMPWNTGASIFFVYAASFAARAGPPRVAVRIILGLMALGVAMAWAVDPPLYSWITVLVFVPLIGGVNLHFTQVGRANARLRLAQEEVEHLAAVAERERIARDLHDVLGHTLSVIILKSELASRLAERDPERAAREIREVEQVSRKALNEVREAIRGYRATLDDEIARARSFLNAAGIRGEFSITLLPLDRAREEALALALREAVTNVVRHAEASVCRVRVESAGRACTLTVEDDGRGGLRAEGHGLRGMRERVEELGGSLALSGAGGTRVTVTVPAAGPAPAPLATPAAARE
ncbi:MAG TPA: sensor histidine kinase [Longimicrobiaceae bacterium]|nr:sensor histidine kinase [Longimicrobiaceae bacterium]